MYSNIQNKPKDRIEFLEETIKAIYDTLKHHECDISDKDSMPIEQLIGREIARIKYNPKYNLNG